jgi:hypothetical protein
MKDEKVELKLDDDNERESKKQKQMVANIHQQQQQINTKTVGEFWYLHVIFS